MNGSRVFRLKENPRVLLIQGYENHNIIQRLRSEEYHLENNYCLAPRSCSILNASLLPIMLACGQTLITTFENPE